MLKMTMGPNVPNLYNSDSDGLSRNLSNPVNWRISARRFSNCFDRARRCSRIETEVIPIGSAAFVESSRWSRRS